MQEYAVVFVPLLTVSCSIGFSIDSFSGERPSIANPYGRASVDEKVDGVIRGKLGRKYAVGG